MRLNVWYIDDEQDLCDNFVDLFSTEEVKVTGFTEPKKAVEASKSNPPDLIFVDYRLPFTTGDQVAFLFDEKIPKFLVTGDITVTTKYRFEKVLNKPYDESAILKIISDYASGTH